jgi:hypothetical protein
LPEKVIFSTEYSHHGHNGYGNQNLPENGAATKYFDPNQLRGFDGDISKALLVALSI